MPVMRKFSRLRTAPGATRNAATRPPKSSVLLLKSLFPAIGKTASHQARHAGIGCMAVTPVVCWLVEHMAVRTCTCSPAGHTPADNVLQISRVGLKPSIANSAYVGRDRGTIGPPGLGFRFSHCGMQRSMCPSTRQGNLQCRGCSYLLTVLMHAIVLLRGALPRMRILRSTTKVSFHEVASRLRLPVIPA